MPVNFSIFQLTNSFCVEWSDSILCIVQSLREDAEWENSSKEIQTRASSSLTEKQTLFYLCIHPYSLIQILFKRQLLVYGYFCFGCWFTNIIDIYKDL